MKDIYKFASALLLLVASFNLVAADIPVSSVQQFKALPKSQQQSLARQYGVDLNALNSQTQSTASSNSNTETVSDNKDNDAANQSVKDRSDRDQSEKFLFIDEERGLPLFGYELFSGRDSDNYTPIDMPVPNNYLIAPGDTIDVQLFGSQNNIYQLEVSRDGSIQFPQLGPIYVAGQTFEELKKNLTNRVKKQILGVDVSISLGALRTMQVYVTGDVHQSGAYNLPSLATVSQALIASGGFRRSGSLRNIVVLRNNKEVVKLDLYDLLLKGDTQRDIRLQSGDTVFVPSKKSSISIYGEVRRPGVYELKPGEKLGQLLDYAGGATATALLEQVEVKRPEGNNTQLLTLDLETTDASYFALKDGDAVKFASTYGSLKSVVVLRGAVARPGFRKFEPQMKLTDLFLNSYEDLLPNTDQNYGLIIRNIGFDTIDVLQFSLAKAFANQAGVDNVELQEGDQIMLFSSNFDVSAWQVPDTVESGQKQAASFASSGQSENRALQVDPETGVSLVSNKTSRLSLGEAESVGRDSQDPYGRERMLAPLIERLKQQSSNEIGTQVIEIRGPVKYPGVYPLIKGGTLNDAIIAAGGLMESASLNKAELTRAVIESGRATLRHQSFSLEDALRSNFTLQSKDRITIQKKLNWTLDNVVQIQGEVVYPGSYSIAKGETLSDLIKRAGGLTSYAYADAAVFSRKVLRLQEEQRIQAMKANLKQEIASLTLRRQTATTGSVSSPAEALSVVDELSSVSAIGRLVIDLPAILEGNKPNDVMLEDGDKLYIPPKRNTVSVLGQVQLTSNFIYQEGTTVDDLISMSGGIKKQADIDRIYVIRANGSVTLPHKSYWFSRKSPSLKPGDAIVVPIDIDYVDGLSTLSTATQILYQIGVAWDAIN